MKAISIRQPWAHAICHMGKRIENRGWRYAPTYRGPILIHAAKGCTVDEFLDGVDSIKDIFRQVGKDNWTWTTIVPALKSLPRGAIVARANLVDVVKPGQCASPWYFGAMGLVLDDVVPLAEPIPWKGELGLFEVPDTAIAGARSRS